MTVPNLFTVKEAAKRCRCAVSIIRRAIQRGELKPSFERPYRMTEDELARWLQDYFSRREDAVS